MTAELIVMGMDRESKTFASSPAGRTASFKMRTGVALRRVTAACASIYAAATTSPSVTPSTVIAATTGSL